jgi:tRNA A37 methylthiotransferase MiaB
MWWWWQLLLIWLSMQLYGWQSGSTAVLKSMRRNYSREAYIELVDHVRKMIPECSISSDFISGFCGETDQDHLETLSLMEHVGYEQAFMFAYSLREKTHAHRHLVYVVWYGSNVDLPVSNCIAFNDGSIHCYWLAGWLVGWLVASDDVPEEVKSSRLQQVIQTFQRKALEKSKLELGKRHIVLVEGVCSRLSAVQHGDVLQECID